MHHETPAVESRTGTIFTGKVGRMCNEAFPVELFLDGDPETPLGVVEIPEWEGTGTAVGIVDKALQKWVTEGLFVKTVRESELLRTLELAQLERLRGVEWYRRTFRFLQVAGSTIDGTRFILTSDKSDLPDRWKRIAEIGEEAVLAEEGHSGRVSNEPRGSAS